MSSCRTRNSLSRAPKMVHDHAETAATICFKDHRRGRLDAVIKADTLPGKLLLFKPFDPASNDGPVHLGVALFAMSPGNLVSDLGTGQVVDQQDATCIHDVEEPARAHNRLRHRWPCWLWCFVAKFKPHLRFGYPTGRRHFVGQPDIVFCSEEEQLFLGHALGANGQLDWCSVACTDCQGDLDARTQLDVMTLPLCQAFGEDGVQKPSAARRWANPDRPPPKEFGWHGYASQLR